MSITFSFRPLDKFPRPLKTSRTWGPFKTTPQQAQRLVLWECEKMGATHVYLLAACTQKDINTFGEIRHDARMAHPGVVVHCEMPKGKPPRRFACDKFTRWESNMKAIAITLERLRLSGIYGVMESDEQYTGFSALPPGGIPTAEWSSVEEAARWLIAQYGKPCSVGNLLGDPEIFRDVYRAVAEIAHPDKGGRVEVMSKVNRCKDFIEKGTL